jgi:hypothetical protein
LYARACRRLAWLSAVSALAAPAFSDAVAQNPDSVISATILDDSTPSLLPVAGAIVCVLDSDNCATTGESGGFTLVAALPTVLSIRADGYIPLQLNVSDTQLPDPIRLQSAIPSFVSTVTAPTTSISDTASLTRITSDTIQHIAPRTAEDVLRLAPGLTLVQHGSEGKGQQYFLRGFDAVHGADFEVLLDGIPLNEWSGIHAQGYLDLGVIIPETVTRVDVMPGSFQPDQGPFAVAGSAHWNTGVPCHDRGSRASVQTGTTGRARAVFITSPRACERPELLAIEGAWDDGFGESRTMRRATLTARTPDARLDHWRLHVTAWAATAAAALPGPVRNDDVERGAIGFYDAYSDQARAGADRAIVAASARALSGDHHARLWVSARRLSLFENFTGFLLYPDQGDWRDQQQQSWMGGLRSSHRWTLAPAWSLTLAPSAMIEHLNQQEFNSTAERQPTATRRDLTGLQAAAAAALSADWQPSGSFAQTVSVRADSFAVDAREAVSDSNAGGVRAAISARSVTAWSPHHAWRATAAYGQGVRPPEARAFSRFDPGTAGLGDSAVQNSGDITRSQAAELGTNWNPTANMDLTAAAFGTWVARESVFDHVSGVSLELNGTRRLGGMVSAHWSPRPWLTAGADVTLVDARFTQSGNPVPLAPNAVSGLLITLDHPSGWTGALRGLWIAPRRLPNGATGATYFGLDATAGYRTASWSLQLAIDNLLQRQLRQGEYNFASVWLTDQSRSQLPAIHTFAGPPLNARLTFNWFFSQRP